MYGKDDISAQEEAQNFGSWLQDKNGNCERTQGSRKEKSEGQKADRCLRPVALRFNFEFSRVYRYGKFASGKFLSVHAMKRHPGTRQSGNTVDPVLIRTGSTLYPLCLVPGCLFIACTDRNFPEANFP